MLELHAIASKKEEGGGRFAVAMTAQENQRFITGIRDDYKHYYSMLGRVNAEASDCSRAADRESIHEGIRLSVGFAQLSRMVFGVMEGWMEEQLREQAAASAAVGDEEEALRWNQRDYNRKAVCFVWRTVRLGAELCRQVAKLQAPQHAGYFGGEGRADYLVPQ